MIYSIEEIKERLHPIFIENGVKQAILFGSYVLGTADDKSDVDILVDSNLRGLAFVGLIEYIREKLKKDVDVIDVTHVEKGSPIDREIAATGVRIYG